MLLKFSKVAVNFVLRNLSRSKDMSLKEVASNRSWGGDQKVFQHDSSAVKCSMKFGIFLPPQYKDEKCPVLYYLSGLTCTEQNVVTKGCYQEAAAQHGIIVVAPDTSPRGCNLPGEDDSYDFGSGAGFYVDATEEPWKNNYQMFSYVTSELPSLIASNFPNADTARCGITGHSMGGHGALICALKLPGNYKSVSAFSPIVNPINCPWGQKAFKGYLGPNESTYKSYDACCLAKQYNGPKLDALIDQGTADQFFEKELLTANFSDACKGTNVTANVRMQDGYDHSYFFMSTFMKDHVNHHAKFLI